MLHIAMAVGLAAGLAVGLLAAVTGSPALMAVATGVEPLGTVFVNAIKMVVIPLVAATVFLGVVRMGDVRRLGRLGGATLAFFWATTIPAILIGMAVMKAALGFAPAVTPPADAGEAAPELPGVVDFLVGLIPANPFEAASQGALLPLIVFTLLFGAAAGTLPAPRKEPLVSVAEAVNDSLIRLVHWILWIAPVGVFGLAAPVTARSGWAMLQSLAVFVVAVILALALFVGLVYLPVVRFLGGVGPSAFLRGCIGPQTIGFTTTSSAASLPVMLEAAEKELRLSPDVSALVLSLGASLNRAGSALFQGAAIIFLASVYQVEIPVAALGGAVLATFMVALTVASVPSAGVMTLPPALDTVGVPLGGLPLLLGVDRIPDMFRTAVNVTGHMAAAVVVDGMARRRDARQGVGPVPVGVGGEDRPGEPAVAGRPPPSSG